MVMLLVAVVTAVPVQAQDTSFCGGHPVSFTYTCGDDYTMWVTICSSKYTVDHCEPHQSEPRIIIYDGWIVIEGTLPPWPIAGTPDTIIGGVLGPLANEGDQKNKDQDKKEPLRGKTRVGIVRLSPGWDVAFWKLLEGSSMGYTLQGRQRTQNRQMLGENKVTASKFDFDGTDFRALATPLPPTTQHAEMEKFRKNARATTQATPPKP
jgi:hypothetical protein